MAHIVKRMVCLANSRKIAGRCVAGQLLENDQPAGWVRPVNGLEHGQVLKDERQYPDGSDPRLLDVIDVPLLEPRPKDYQTENWLLDPDYYWEKRGRVSWTGLDGFIDDRVADLWTNGESTNHGKNDRINVARANQFDHSLCLVKLPELRLSVFAPEAESEYPKRRVQARFDHNGTEYWLWVTDPECEREYLRREDGDYDLGECFATISLSEPYRGYCYKLVAAIIEPAN